MDSGFFCGKVVGLTIEFSFYAYVWWSISIRTKFQEIKLLISHVVTTADNPKHSIINMILEIILMELQTFP